MNISRDNYTTEIFNNKQAAENAYNDAIKDGYTPEEINVIMSEDSRKKYYDSELVTDQPGDKSMEGLALGGALGGSVGGVLAAVAAIGTNVAIPGLGLVIAGPLAAGLAGAGAGGITGGLTGALVGAGIPEDKVGYYEDGIKSGGIVLGVPERPESHIRTDWDKYKNS